MKTLAVSVMVSGLLLVAVGFAPAAEPSVWTVESGELPKKVTVGDTVRFFAHAAQPKGSIEVTADDAGKIMGSFPSIVMRDGKVVTTGTKDMVYDIKAAKTGKIKLKVTIKDGAGKSDTKEYEIEVEEAK